jgi:hypothetical protein
MEYLSAPKHKQEGVLIVPRVIIAQLVHRIMNYIHVQEELIVQVGLKHQSTVHKDISMIYYTGSNWVIVNFVHLVINAKLDKLIEEQFVKKILIVQEDLGLVNSHVLQELTEAMPQVKQH